MNQIAMSLSLSLRHKIGFGSGFENIGRLELEPPVVKLREDFCQIRHSLDESDTNWSCGEASISTQAVLWEIELERLEEQRLSDYSYRVREYQEKSG